ncbi:MAG: VOC family protein [Dehalococcoidia bacterium]
MTIVSLQHVQVNVPAPRATEAKRFYAELLGLTEMPRPQSLNDAGRAGIWYRIGTDQEFHVFLDPDPGGDASASSRHPALIVDDLDALRARLTDAGVEIEDAIPIAGRARFFARDPGGNRLEFLAFVPQ